MVAHRLHTNHLDPQTFILRGTAWCTALAHLQYYWLLLFYSTYLCHLMLRLETSFEGSYLALPRVTIYIFRSLISMFCVISLVLLIADITRLECIETWYSSDTDWAITTCTIPLRTMIVHKYYWFPTISVLCCASIASNSHCIVTR